MFGLVMRLLIQALGMHYYKNKIFQQLCTLDVSVKLFTEMMAYNLFYCLSFSPLPLASVGYDKLLYDSPKSQILWHYAKRFYSITGHLTRHYQVINFSNWSFKWLRADDIGLSQTKSLFLVFKNRRVEAQVIIAVFIFNS